MGRVKAASITSDAYVEYHGDVTVGYVVMSVEGTKQVFSGTARRTPGDKYDPEIGADLALGRAMEAAAHRLLKRGNGLVKHGDDIRHHHEKLSKQVRSNLKLAEKYAAQA